MSSRKFTNDKKFLAAFIGLILTFCTCINVFANENTVDSLTAKKLNILVLNSYHKGFTWTDNQTDGITETLKNSKLDCDISVEYLDWKRYPTNYNLENMYNVLKLKYSKIKIDLIVTTDDAALSFSLNSREALFSNAPIVFSGVTKDDAKKITSGYSNVTGIYEDLDAKNTIKMATDLIPNLKNIYLLFDNTESGYSTGDLAINAIKQGFPDLNLIPLNNSTHTEIIEKSKTLSKNSIFILLSYYRDIDGNSIDFEEFNRLLFKDSSVPIFHLYDFGLNNGSIGGSMISGKSQGEKAANLGLLILNGKSASSIPFISEGKQSLILDYNLLSKFNIPLKNVPKGVEIIHKPFSFVETYKTLVYSTLTIFIFLVIFIIILLFYLNRIKKMKRTLENNNEELSALYEELAASEEEIRSQFGELLQARDDLMVSEERYSLVAECTSDGIWDLDIKTDTIFHSDKWYEMIGYTKEEFSEAHGYWEDIIHPEDLLNFHKTREKYFENPIKKYECEFRLKLKNGEYIWIHSQGKAFFDENNKPYRMIGSHTDISDIKKYQSLLNHSAYHDTLTGLFNRFYLYEEIGTRMKNIMPIDSIEALIFIDTDNFKFVNDSMGHYFGDKLLVEISKRLSELTDMESYVFRLGGDEFVFYMKNAISKEIVEDRAKSIIRSFNDPFDIEHNKINITISMGISLFPQDGTTLDILLRNADMAMYKVKENGRNSYYFYNALVDQEMITRVNIEKHLKRALNKNEFIVYYQPQVDIKTKEILGFEALIRWINPELGFVPPSEFIDIAEKTGLIVAIGQWILTSSCKFIKQINETYKSNYKIAVNISVIQLMQDNFIDMLWKVLAETGLDPSMLELEITESIVMDSPDLILQKLNLLRNNNIGIAMDDFGTGYSSLAYLRKLPVTTLKIDKLFIDDILSINSNNTLVDSIITLGHKIGLTVVAEGVETSDQLKYLEINKCDILQGYLFSKPLPANEIEKLIQNSTLN